MRSAKRITGFFTLFLVAFVLLMVPWPGLQEGYGAGFRAVGNALFVRFGSAGAVRFRPISTADPDRDMELVLQNRQNGAEYIFTGSTRLQGYKPTAFVLALTLATPIPWRRRWRALLWGFLLVNLYVALRVVVFLLAAFSGDNSLALFTFGPVVKSALDYIHWVVVISFAGWLILPLPIWAFVSLRRQDWRTIVQGTQTALRGEQEVGR